MLYSDENHTFLSSLNIFSTVPSPLSHRHPSMETPLDVLSRAASFVHANEEESKFSPTPLCLAVEVEFRHMSFSAWLSKVALAD